MVIIDFNVEYMKESTSLFMQKVVESLAKKFCINLLRERYKLLSDCYRNLNPKNVDYIDAVSYAVVRMPATYAVISDVINEFYKKIPNYKFEDILDIGSGTGALACYFSKQQANYTAVEKSKSMMSVCSEIITKSNLNYEIVCSDASKYLSNNIKHDCSFFVYSLNELKSKRDIICSAINNTNDYVFIIEPGTPAGFQNILLAKTIACNLGLGIVAPCANCNCSLADNDWCHFSTRVIRSHLHNSIKGGKLPYEDEKYSYIIISKTNSTILSGTRIIKRPIKMKGYVLLDVCTNAGIKRVNVTDKKLKKASWGEDVNQI